MRRAGGPVSMWRIWGANPIFHYTHIFCRICSLLGSRCAVRSSGIKAPAPLPPPPGAPGARPATRLCATSTNTFWSFPKASSVASRSMAAPAPSAAMNSWLIPRASGPFPAESARRVGHPAPFPIELPYRLIQLYTFSSEVVLDPFMGSGQTALAARQAGRHFIGLRGG